MTVYTKNEDCIFFHIYRTGGRSIKLMIGGIGLIPLHPTAIKVKQFCYENNKQKLWENSFKFTSTRNPFDWQLSVYRYIQKVEKHKFYDIIKNFTLSQYINWLGETAVKEYPDIFNTQYYFVCDENGKLLMDFYCKLENIKEDIRYVCNKLKIEYPEKLPFIYDWKKEKEHYMNFYNDNDKILMKEIFKDDFVNFNYV